VYPRPAGRAREAALAEAEARKGCKTYSLLDGLQARGKQDAQCASGTRQKDGCRRSPPQGQGDEGGGAGDAGDAGVAYGRIESVDWLDRFCLNISDMFVHKSFNPHSALLTRES
jgi:hypothetical protein